ncbi:uncharacterized protein [Musca autumnalis]|uniref:uncharacterized protein n=1 Tax=Musca autumnalis TaxID=221902 RepID=UPI003CF17D8A
MSVSFCIKTEPIAKDYEEENSNSDTNTLSYNTTKIDLMVTDIKEDELDLDQMEEFLPENADEYTIDIIKEEGVDEMDEFIPENLPSNYSPSSPKWASNDLREVTTHDILDHQQVTPQHLTTTITQQISLPKLEIMDVHEGEQDSDGLEINCDTDAKVSDNKKSSREVAMVLNKKLLKHKRTDKTCEDKNTEKSAISPFRGAQTHTEHKCKLCGKSYKEETNLWRHIRDKHPMSMDTEYICKICHRQFTTQTGLDRHSNRTHSVAQTPTKHKCEICGIYFKEILYLQTHIRKKHPSSIDTEYMCEICSQKFTTQSGLDRHSFAMHPIVQKSTKHKCKICGTFYTESYGLQAHIRRKHTASIDLKYICEICNQGFTTHTGLTRHSVRMHPVT